ncbi:MAG TPA: hypothetical protein VFB60_09870 [Ktedonobacteraceae bacterium]|nr:hypothetical protein [Ktedonobacteraceae bacterium]
MMPQMDAGEPIREQPQYGRYEGQQYGAPHSSGQQDSPLDDNLVEAIAQRMSQIMGQGSAGKIYGRSKNPPTTGMKLALAIVSLVALIALAAILIGGIGGFGGLIGFGMACLTVILVNVAFGAGKF